jgi:hypothetical protein
MKWHEVVNLVLSFIGGICLPLYIAFVVQPKLDNIKQQQSDIVQKEKERERREKLKVDTGNIEVTPTTRELLVYIRNYGTENSDAVSVSIQPFMTGLKLPSVDKVSERDGAPFEKSVSGDGTINLVLTQGIGPNTHVLFKIPEIRVPKGYNPEYAPRVTVFSKGSLIYPAGGQGGVSLGGSSSW